MKFEIRITKKLKSIRVDETNQFRISMQVYLLFAKQKTFYLLFYQSLVIIMNSYVCLLVGNADILHLSPQLYENEIKANSNCNHPQMNYTTLIFAHLYK